MSSDPQDIPRLNIVPRQPAGMPTSHTSRSIRQKLFYEARIGGVFGVEEPKTARRSNKLSQRDIIAAKADKAKYNAWLKHWDHDPGIKRYLMLKDIVNNCKGFSKAQLDDLFGNSSELVFMHIYVFVRWNCRTGCSVALQLQALRVFFDASSGSCFVEHFLKKGGTEVLLYYLEIQNDLVQEDITEIIKTFLSLSTNGAHSIQLILETKFLEVYLDALPKFKTDEQQELTVMLFTQLCEGNAQYSERFTSALRSKFTVYQNNPKVLLTAAHSFRLLFSPQLAADCDVKNQISEFLVLPSSENLDVQHEAVAIFSQIIENTNDVRRKYLFDILLDLISISIEDVPAHLVDIKMRQQTFALKLLNIIIVKNGEALEKMTSMIHKFLPALVRTLANSENFAAQKTACNVIKGFVKVRPQSYTYLTNAIPKEWVDQMIENPHKFCIQITPTQLDTFIAVDASMFFFDTNDEPQQEVIEQKRETSRDSIRDTSSATTTARKKLFTPTPIIKPSVVLRESPFRFQPSTNFSIVL